MLKIYLKGYEKTTKNALITQKNAQGAANQNAITAKNAAILARTAEIGTLQGEINTLNTDDMVHVGDLKYDIPGRPQAHNLRYQSRFPCYGPSSVGGFFWGYGTLSDKLLPECNAMSGLYSTMLHATEGLTKVDVVFKTHNKYMHSARIAELRNTIAEKHRQNHADTTDVNRLNQENEQLRKEIIACEREKIQGQANVQIRTDRLRNEITVRRQWLANAMAELTLATARKVALQQKLVDANIEITVNQDLFNIVYRMARILDLGGIDTISRFMRSFEAANPEVVPNYDQWFIEMLENARARHRVDALDLAMGPAGARAGGLPQFRAYARAADRAANAAHAGVAPNLAQARGVNVDVRPVI